MSKVIYIIGSLLVVTAIIMFVYQTWSLNNTPSSDVEYYIKSVSNDSFSWFNYKIHALMLGIALILINKFTSLFGS